MVDDPIIHMPKTARYISASLLFIGAIGFIGLAYYLAESGKGSDVEILIWMSLVQLLLTGFALLMVFGFSQKSLGFPALHAKASEFLSKEVPLVISNIHFTKPVPLKTGAREPLKEVLVEVGHYDKDYRADYWICRKKEKSTDTLLVDLSLRVSEAMLVVKLPLISLNEQTYKEPVDDLLERWIVAPPFVMTQQKFMHYDKYLGTPALHIYFKAQFDEKFLVTPSERLLCAQAAAAIIRDLLLLADDSNFPLLDSLLKPR